MARPGTQTSDSARAGAEAAQDHGRELAQSTAESAQQVAQTVKDEASNVVGEVASQARSLTEDARDQVRDQVDQQRSRAAEALRRTGEELRSLTNEQDHSRLTTALTSFAAEKARAVADYLEHTSPAEILDEVRDFARRRPGAFLLAAGIAGAVVGRLVRSAASSSSTAAGPRASGRPELPRGSVVGDQSVAGGADIAGTDGFAASGPGLETSPPAPGYSGTTYAGSTSPLAQRGAGEPPIPLPEGTAVEEVVIIETDDELPVSPPPAAGRPGTAP